MDHKTLAEDYLNLERNIFEVAVNKMEKFDGKLFELNENEQFKLSGNDGSVVKSLKLLKADCLRAIGVNINDDKFYEMSNGKISTTDRLKILNILERRFSLD